MYSTQPGSIHAITLELLTSAWFRGSAPVVVAIAFELVLRYAGMSENDRWDRENAFIALSLTGIAVAALPGLIAVHTERLHSTDAVTAGGFALCVVVIGAYWLACFDRRALRQRRRDDGRVRGLLVATMVPNLLAAAVLGLIFAFAP